MKEKIDNKWIITAILATGFIIYSILAFGVVGYRGSQFLITYLFTIISYASMLTIIWKICGKDNSLKDIYLGLPVIKEGAIYLVIQTFLSFLFMMLPAKLIIISIAIQLLLLLVYWILVLTAIGARNAIVNIDNKIWRKRNYLEVMKIEVESIKMEENDLEIKKALGDLSELIRFSDPMSSHELESLENDIMEKVTFLSMDYQSISKETKMEQIKIITNKVNVRNMKCKMLK